MRNRFKPPRSTTERAAQANLKNQAYQRRSAQEFRAHLERNRRWVEEQAKQRSISNVFYNVSDNPFKPGTQDHKDWELENIHIPRRTQFYHPQTVEAQRTASQRLSLLKQQVQAKRTWVDSLLEELPGADEPEFPRGSYRLARAGWEAVSVPKPEQGVAFLHGRE